MLFAFSVAPVVTETEDASMSHIVARAVKVVEDSGLPNRTDSMFTTIEGTWDEVMPVIKRATEAIADVSPRVSLVLKADIRHGHDDGELEGKVERLNKEISDLQ